MTDVFISYAHEDHDYVRRMAPALEAEGFSVWWDHTIPPGKSWDEVIAKGIADARCCMVLWSKHSVISDWVKEEATIAKDHRKFIPVQIDNSEPPVGFRRIQAAHLQNWNGNVNDPQWQMLVREIRSVTSASRASGAASPPPMASGGGYSTTSTYAPRAYEPPPRSGPSPLAIAAMVIAGLVALGALGYAMFGGRDTPSQDYAQTDQVTPAPAPAPAAAPPPSLDPEIERLRAERDAALEAQRRAEAAAALQRQQQQRQQQVARPPAPAPAPAPSLVGTWRGRVTWDDGSSANGEWTLHSNGRFTTSDGYAGAWTQNGSQMTLSYETRNGQPFSARTYYRGRYANGAITGTISNNDGNTARFSMSRAGAAAAQTVVAASPVGTWVGTHRWSDPQYDRDRAETIFRADGVVVPYGIETRGVWRQNGNRITWSLGPTEYEATISGNTMVGTIRHGNLTAQLRYTRQ